MNKLTGIKFYICDKDKRVYLCFVNAKNTETFYQYDRCKHYMQTVIWSKEKYMPWACKLVEARFE